MVLRDHFSTEEWAQIESAPFLIGSATAMAAKSGMIGTMREFSTLGRLISAAVETYPGNRIIREILPSREMRQTTKGMADDEALARLKASERAGRTPTEEADLAIANLAAALTLLKGVAIDSEISEYRQWVRSIARKVAETAREGGIFDRRVDPISAEEAAFLARIDRVLYGG